MRLTPGVVAPSFSATDIDGRPVTVEEFRGRRLWLILSRFAACPFCSLRLHEVAARHETVAAFGVDVLVVFPSPERRVRQYVKKYEPPFRVVADPEQKVFALFGSETSWAGELRSAINVPKVLKALMQAKMNPLAFDAPVHRMPSEYLIEPDGAIGAVHYGEEMDDGFPIGEVVHWAKGEAADRDGEDA